MTPKRMLAIALVLLAFLAVDARADSRQELDRDGKKALQTLISKVPAAKMLNGKAVAVLVFPDMVKAGFMFGGQIGEGVLLRGGKSSGYYNSVGASYGLQAGAQKFGYALFFMNEKSLQYLNSSEGFEVGMGPSFVVVDEGKGKSMTTTTATQDVYAFIFSQQGLMGGLGLQGTKITKLEK
ncbi:MAG: YSC84-related protein [Myxococcota bacterium]